MKQFCCETSKSFYIRFSQIIKEEASKLPEMMRNPYIEYADSLDYCAVCGASLMAGMVKISVQQENISMVPTETKPNVSLPPTSEPRIATPDFFICPVCKGTGEMVVHMGKNTVANTCLQCLGKGKIKELTVTKQVHDDEIQERIKQKRTQRQSQNDT